MKRLRFFLLAALGVLLLLTAFAAGFLARPFVESQGRSAYPLLEEAHQLLSAHYLADLPPATALERAMIRGMVEAIGDPFTVYLEPAAHELMTDTLSGEYGGIGALISRDPGGRVRLVPLAGGPAEAAGVIEGDILLRIGGEEVAATATLDEIGASLRGPAGTVVQIALAGRAPGDSAFLLDIVRRAIPLPSLTGYLSPADPRLGVLAFTTFSERSAQELEAAFRELSGRGAQGLILDLRGNPGGLLESGIEVAGFFLEEGIVVIERRRGGEEETVHVEAPGPASDIPLAVIVDAGTASSAEIVAAALQANGRAVVIGTETFGKGSVQLIFELSDGSSLHVTSAQWLTPAGRAIDGVGLVPDIPIEGDAGDPRGDPALMAAVDWLSAELAEGP
jgi:carboxyl-terminal processing protease